jgi:thioredoxin 1
MKVELYSSSFCGACDATRGVLAEVTRLVPAAEVVELNVATAPQRAEAVGIVATPTVVLRGDDGAELFRAAGVPRVDQVLTAIAQALEPPHLDDRRGIPRLEA